MARPVENVFYHCSFCNTYVHRDRYVSHISNRHRHQRYFRVYCGERSCGRSFSSVKTLQRHIKMKHDAGATIDYSTSIDPDLSNAGATETVIEAARESDRYMKLEEATYLLKLREKGKLSEVDTRDLIENTKHLLGKRTASLKAILEQRIEEASGNQANVMVPDWEDIFNTDTSFDGLATEHLQRKFFTEEFSLLDPVPIKLGEELVWRNGQLVVKPHLCYVVDFLRELENYLSNPHVLQHILERNYDINEVYSDFCSGDAFRNHPVFQEDRSALQVIAYEDDLEVVNPLGTKVKIHKIAVFYWFLGNIHPRHRSSSRHIHLMCMALTKHVKQYGIGKMVANFISGVNKLAEGYIMNIRGEEKMINGALLSFIGDTLSSNFIAGFKESVSFAERKCRTCLCSVQDMKTKFTDEDFIQRDLQQHLHHCDLLSNSSTKQEKAQWSKMYGVTSLSVFHQALGFNVCTGFPHDAMHVLLEGVVPLEVKLLLKYCIEEQYFSVDKINAKLKCFSYGYSERKNAPTPIYKKVINSEDGKLKQSASQMLLLSEILPFLIGQMVPEHDVHWKSFLLLRQIVRLCTSFELHERHINMLRVLIQEHHQLFVEVYGERNFMPKHHYMVHFPAQIQRFGPLRQHWCMRLEAKHNFFKNDVTGNFKNITKSLARRHQMWMCSQLLPGNSDGFLYAGHQLCGGNNFPVAGSYYRGALERKLAELGQVEVDFAELQSAILYGEEYRTDGYILYKEEDEDGFPVFAQICKIVSLIGTLYAVIKTLETYCHSSHYDGYRINQILDPEYTCVELSTLKHHKVLHAHPIDGHVYISMNQIPIIDLLD